MKRLVLDIETVPLTDDLLSAEENKKAALDALTGRIVCIGLIVVDEFRAQSAIAIVSNDERKLIDKFWSILQKENIRSFVGHNGLSFDLPYIWRRSVIHQVKPTVHLDLRRYRSDFVYDTMCVWGNWESRGNVSLNALAGGLGLGEKSGSGDQVLELWRNRQDREIADYCLQDCWLTYECYCRMNFSAATEKSLVKETIDIDVSTISQETTEAVVVLAS